MTYTAQVSSPEALPSRLPRGVWQLALRQFANPITAVLIVAALTTVVLGETVDGLILLTIIVMSGLLGFAQEWRASVAIEDLLGQTRLRARILRRGEEVSVAVEDLRVGDTLVLRPGDVVAADVILDHADRLVVDESAITGESVPCEKSADPVEPAPDTVSEEKATGLPSNMVFLGSHVTSGIGQGQVSAVGPATRFGQVVAMFAHRTVQTRFEREMASFGLMLTRVIAVLVAIVTVINLLLDRPLLQAVLFALAIGVGITPQLLPAITAVSLAFGAKRMARQQVLVKRLDAIEDAGAMTLLCCDKTGTLTRGVMTLDQAVDISGRESERVLELAGLNAGLQRGFPNALDRAIVEASGPSRGELLSEIPYDFQRRRLSVLVTEQGSTRLITKGAVESVLGVCSRVRVQGASSPIQSTRDALSRQVEQWGQAGFRVLAVASKDMQGSELSVSDEDDMVLEGFLLFADPPTSTARESLAELARLGVGVALITGDNVHSARHVATAVGLPAERIVTGQELAGLTEEELQRVVREVRVFAEIDPLQKHDLVMHFQAAGESVGFLGDGINDAAALRVADVGISVAGSADAATHAASVVILTKRLDVIADGIRLGRQTFSNTVKYIRVTISANFGNMVSLVVASAFLPFLPLLPIHILLLNLLSDIPALTLSRDSVDAAELSGPGAWSRTSLRRFMIWFGLVSSTIDIGAFLLLSRVFNVGEAGFHTAWFVLSVVTECVALLVLRSDRPLGTSSPGRWLVVTSLIAIVASVALTFPPIGSMVGFIPLSLPLTGLIAALCIGYIVFNEVLKIAWRRSVARHDELTTSGHS